MPPTVPENPPTREDLVRRQVWISPEQKFDWQAEDYFEKYQRAKGLRFQYGVQAGQRLGAKVLVDDIDETVYQAYGSVPAGVFIVDEDGNLAYKAEDVDVKAVEKALKELL